MSAWRSCIPMRQEWYRRGMDLHVRLPWLSAYMGYTDIPGTGVYLTTCPGRGRDIGCPIPPAQIPTGGITA